MLMNLARLLPLVMLFALGARAQEATDPAEMPAIDDLEPGVSAATLEAIDDSDVADETEAAAPPVLAQDIRRSETAGGVMDEIDLGRTEVTGNQELPKVLYIVPWQKSAPGELMGKPVNSLLDEVLAPIDRTEFVRQVDYYGDLYGVDEEQ